MATIDHGAQCSLPGKPRVILAACGSDDGTKFLQICQIFADWADIRVVVTESVVMIPQETCCGKEVVFNDESEWSSKWLENGDSVLHLKLHEWAHIMVIAPLSPCTLAKIVSGFCDNLMTRIVRVWDKEKPLFVAPSMNRFMWRNPSTRKHCIEIQKLGITIVPLATGTGSGEFGSIMASPSAVFETVRDCYEEKMKKKKDSDQV